MASIYMRVLNHAIHGVRRLTSWVGLDQAWGQLDQSELLARPVEAPMDGPEADG